MLDLFDHTAHRRRVFELAAAVHLVKAETDKGGALIAAAPDGAADLGQIGPVGTAVT